jgi:hypothetical protein
MNRNMMLAPPKRRRPTNHDLLYSVTPSRTETRASGLSTADFVLENLKQVRDDSKLLNGRIGENALHDEESTVPRYVMSRTSMGEGR